MELDITQNTMKSICTSYFKLFFFEEYSSTWINVYIYMFIYIYVYIYIYIIPTFFQRVKTELSGKSVDQNM